LAARSSAAVQRKNLVGFEVNGVCYALDILQVREIIRPLNTLRIPSRGLIGGHGLIGVADHRGHVVPVIDLRERFAGLIVGGGASVTSGLRSRDRDARWLIVALHNHLVGLVVDRVTEVFGSSQPASRDVSHLSRPEVASLIQAAYRHRGVLVFVLELERLASEAEIDGSDPLPESESIDGGA
jgi:purine-binding chemotaxis protein CheW